MNQPGGECGECGWWVLAVNAAPLTGCPAVEGQLIGVCTCRHGKFALEYTGRKFQPECGAWKRREEKGRCHESET